MPVSDTLCSGCISGVRHEGTPTGKVEQIAGVDVYVATPPGEYAKDKALLYVSDAFGLSLPNALLMADDFAINGIRVFMIDLFNGDVVPVRVLDERDTDYDLDAWVERHDEQATRPPLDAVIATLKERGIKDFGATGYCFGGKYVFNLAQENVIKVGAVSHPSLLRVPEDIEKLKTQSKAPLLINSCDDDPYFPIETCLMGDNLLGEGRYAPGYKRVHWTGCTHGFAIRSGLNDPKVKWGKEGAFMETVTWIKKYL